LQGQDKNTVRYSYEWGTIFFGAPAICPKKFTIIFHFQLFTVLKTGCPKVRPDEINGDSFGNDEKFDAAR